MRSTALLVALLVLTIPASVGATDFSIFGSYFDTDDYDEAVGAGARVAFGGRIQFELSGTYYDQFGSSFDLRDLELRDVTLDLDVIPIDVGLRFGIGGGPIYFSVGGTYYLLDAEVGSVDDEVGVYGRVGIQFGHFFVEGGLRDVEGSVDDVDFDDLNRNDVLGDITFDLSGYFVNAGWRF